MWHEARKHEKKLRVLIVDYRRRAERRREYYEKFKADPAQFMQVHGRPCKIHMDPQITAAAENCMMPWQGNSENMIDRFDARAHLDRIPDGGSGDPNDGLGHGLVDRDEEAALNYERYRILIQNDLAGVTEDKFLQQIYVEEQFGTPSYFPNMNKGAGDQAKTRTPKAAIGFTYEDTNLPGSVVASPAVKTGTAQVEEQDEESDEDIDFDLLVNVKDLNLAQQAELNNGGIRYGMAAGDFMRFLNADLEEKEQLRLAKLQEEEKQTMSGRKARRERRAYKDRIIMRKGYISPPSYAARSSQSPHLQQNSSSDSGSKSRSPSAEKITFITSFGENNSDDDKRRNSKVASYTFGPVLPAEGLPLAKKWKRRRSLSKSPRRLKSRSRSRSRSGRERTTRRRRSSSSDNSSRGVVSSKGKASSGKSAIWRNRDTVKSSGGASRSRRTRSDGSVSRSRSRSRNRERGRKRSGTRSPERHYSRDRGTKKSSRRRRRSSSSRRNWSGSSTKYSHKRRYSTSSSSSSSSSSPIPSRIALDSPAASKLPSPPVKRYYDRAKAAHEDDKSEESFHSDSSGDEKNIKTTSGRSTKVTSSVSSNKPSVSTSSKDGTLSGGPKLTPQERLKRRMQAALNRQLKADKEAEKSRIEKQVQQRLEREESLRELSIKYRRREREKRHRNQMLETDSSKSSGSSRSASRSRSRSASRSPCRDF